METDIVAGAEGGEHALGMKVSVEMEAHLDPSPVLQKGKPTEQPAAAATRSMYWNPYCKRLETGWYMGRWKNDQRRCLYHLQTSTAVSLIAGDDVGTFGIRWTADSEPMVLDIDNVDFCIDHNAIVTNGSLDNPDLEATIGEKLRVVLTGRKLPAEELKFKPARIYNDTETSQLVAIVGSPEHSNAENIKHVLVAEVTDSGNIAVADISKITKAKKEHLVRVNGRCCNEEKLLADIRRTYFPSFATGSQQPLLQPKMRDWVNMTSPAGDLCLGNLLQDYYKEQKNEQRTNESDGKSSSSTFDTTTSNERNQMEQQWPGSQQENENSKKLSDIREENNRLQQELCNVKEEKEKLFRQLISSQQKDQILTEELLESQESQQRNFELFHESQQENRALTQEKEENKTLILSLVENMQIVVRQLVHNRKENQTLTQQLTNSKQEVSDSNEKIQTLKRQVSDSSKENQTLKQQVSNSSKENQTLKQLAYSNEQIQTLNHQLLNHEVQIQNLQEQLSTTQALCSHQHHLLPGAEMIEISLPHIMSKANDNNLLVSHLARCSSCQLVLPFVFHVRTCSNWPWCCEKCKKIVNLYTVHVSHCQETNCSFPYCTHCKTIAQQRNLSTQDLATDPGFKEEVRHCLCAITSQANEDEVLFPPGEPDPRHMYSTSYELQFLLLTVFLSFARPVQRLTVQCFNHHENWSSLFHEKNCFVCRFFQQVLRRCGTCRFDMCFTCVNACCACAEHALTCHNNACRFPFCHPSFKCHVRQGDTIFPSQERLSQFREHVHRLCFPQGQDDETS